MKFESSWLNGTAVIEGEIIYTLTVTLTFDLLTLNRESAQLTFIHHSCVLNEVSGFRKFFAMPDEARLAKANE